MTKKINTLKKSRQKISLGDIIDTTQYSAIQTLNVQAIQGLFFFFILMHIISDRNIQLMTTSLVKSICHYFLKTVKV